MAAETAMAPHEHWLLADVSMDDLAPVLAAGEERHFAPGESVLVEGADADGLFLILDGSVRVTAQNDQGETFLALVRPNEVLGEMGVLDGEVRSGTAIALTPTVAYFLPTEPFLQLLERCSLVSNRLLILLTNRLRLANRRLLELAPGGPVSRRTTPITP